MDTSPILKQFDIAQVEAKKKELEEKLNTAHRTGENISVLNADLAYYTTLFTRLSQLKKESDRLEQAQEMLKTEKDEEMLSLAQTDIDQAAEKISSIEQEILDLEVERKFVDPDDNKSVIMEIRGGAGGEEASLFAADLFRMYSNFAKKKNWQVEVIDSSLSSNGGFKEIVARIAGNNVYKHMKYESGVHRVQRVPVTETGGRIHTSTASVAILPEAQDIEVQINPQDLRVDVMRASGPGGQSVNRTESAVRITHIPTGIVVSCRETKYQNQNREKAMQLLRARLYEKEKMEADSKRSGMRSSQIGSAMRAEKVRTYNFPQNRITDHRVKMSWSDIEGAFAGNIEEMVDSIRTQIQKQQIVK
jgi:peptide chain release factor 1